ncbi:MAG: AAA family ATPase [Tannerellaceae bacterium]|jgi:predicted ATP-binding protein involved in virulence|nr:AAA family ATPase [Tannerellaceae bacterium]
MKIESIEIHKLFDLFDYKIELNQDENLTILTGPNGYGKTSILNIIYNLFNDNGSFYYFQKLLFSEIIFHFDNQYRLEVRKNIESAQVLFYIYGENHTEISRYDYASEENIKKQIERYIPFVRRISQDKWLDKQQGRIYSFAELLNEFSGYLPFDLLNALKNNGLGNAAMLNIFEDLQVYLIKEQRLIKQNQQIKYDELEISHTNTILDYAKELSSLIEKKQAESFTITQKLDGSFPKRLLESRHELSKEEFDNRFEQLRVKYDKLNRFGLITSSLDIPPYDDKSENLRVLSIYLDDSHQKVAVFDELLNKIELFTDILNQKRFTHKAIQINKENGFMFISDRNNTALSLTDLSSGEQHEVVLLYELLFRVKPGTIVLVDEPEISLHVSWQQEFINDLIKISKMQQIRFIVATHSPTIINNRETVDLYALTQNN